MKFKTGDTAYLAARKQLSEKYGPRELWSAIDHWPLYCGVGNLSRFLAIAEILKQTLSVPGHIAEFGSWRGANLLFMAKLLRIFDPLGSKVVHSFDSFEGLQTFAPEDGAAVATRGQYRGSFEELTDMISLYGMNDDIEIHKGWIDDTLPALLRERTEFSLSLVYVDVDLYAPTRTILDACHSRLSSGGVVVFDEWNHEKFPGETVAARDFLDAHAGEYRPVHVANARQPSMYLVKR
ncbi:MAG: TylF/MycF/NovP-related O-methyltransferase [Gammaproteobacteria bacterium]